MSIKLATLGGGKINLPAVNFGTGTGSVAASTGTGAGLFTGFFLRIPASFPNRNGGGSYLVGYDADNSGSVINGGNDVGAEFWGPGVGGAARCLTAMGAITGTSLWDFTNDRNWTLAAPVAAGDYLFIYGIVNLGSSVLKHFKALIPVNGTTLQAQVFVAGTACPNTWAGIAQQWVDRIFSTVGDQTEVGFAVEHLGIIEGAFPLSSGSPDKTWLANLASGAKTWKDLATAIGGDLRCWYQLKTKTDLNDQSTHNQSACTLTDTGGTSLVTDTAIAPAGFTNSITLQDVTLKGSDGAATTAIYAKEPSGWPVARLVFATGSTSNITLGGTLGQYLSVGTVNGEKVLLGKIPDNASGTLTITQVDAAASNSPHTTTFTTGSTLTRINRGGPVDDGSSRGGMPTKHYLRPATNLAACKAVEFKDGSGGSYATDVTAPDGATLMTLLGNRTVNQWHRIRLTGAASAYTGILNLPSRDMGTGGVVIDGQGLVLDSQFQFAGGGWGTHAIIWRLTFFCGPSSSTASSPSFIFNFQGVPAVGAGVRGLRMRWEGTCGAGYLFKAGATLADWATFPAFISCFHAEQMIIDSGFVADGVNCFCGFSAVDYVSVGDIDIRRYRTVFGSLFSVGEAFYLGETQRPTINGKCNYFLTKPIARAQADISANLTSADHTDFVQINPGDVWCWMHFAGGTIPGGQTVTPTAPNVNEKLVYNGYLYRLKTKGTGNVTVPPTNTSGDSSADSGYVWTCIGADNPVAVDIDINEITTAENGVAQATDGSHAQTTLVRDSSANRGRTSATGVTIVSGTIVASSSQTFIEASSNRSAWVSYSIAGPPPDTSTNASSNAVLSSCMISSGCSGSIETFRSAYYATSRQPDFFGTTSTGPIWEVDRATVGGNANVISPNRPGDVFKGTFTTKAANGSWIFPALDVNNLSRSKAVFRALMEAQFTTKGGLLAKFLRALLRFRQRIMLGSGTGL